MMLPEQGIYFGTTSLSHLLVVRARDQTKGKLNIDGLINDILKDKLIEIGFNISKSIKRLMVEFKHDASEENVGCSVLPVD